MRLSVDNGDYGWDVWLDGVLQKYAVMADDEKGEVERYNAGNFFGTTERVYGKVEIRRSEPKGTPKPANVQGLVAPVWSDSGEVQGCAKAENWSLKVNFSGGVAGYVSPKPLRFTTGIWRMLSEPCKFVLSEYKPSDPSAKPSLPALTRESGNKRGPGWCEE